VLSFERALEALAHLPENRGTLEQVIDLRFDVRSSLFPLGQLKATLEHLREAERLAKVLDDQRRNGWAAVYMSECFRLTGDLPAARRCAQSACTIAETLDEFSLQIAANFYMGNACLSTGDLRRAADLFCKIAHLLVGDRTRERCRLAGFPAAMSRAYLAWVLGECGEFDEGIARGVEGIRIGEALDHPFSLALACWGLAELYIIRGEHDQAIALAERGLALCRDWSLTVLSPVLARVSGHAYALSGRVVEGVSFLRNAVTGHESAGRRGTASSVFGQLGEALLLAGQLEDADAFATRSLVLTREVGGPGPEAWALRLLDEIASYRQPPDVAAAESRYRQALALAEPRGMRPLIAHCHLGLGTLYRRTGKREQAHEHLTTATTMYREMGMTYWLEKAKAEIDEFGQS
jgi:tetratricopeptide (TPR) repeat protein